MSFTDHKITAFAHRVADLPDEPQIPAADLKSRFDACPEELRQSLNAVCDDAARLEARVEGIVVDTFGDTIDKEMLSDELAAELDGKATQSALASETAARESADSAEAAARTALAEAIAQKCEVYIGTYHGDNQEVRSIILGFQPKAVLLFTASGWGSEGSSYYGGLATSETPVRTHSGIPATVLEITEDGFQVFYNSGDKVYTNSSSVSYIYIVIK